MRIVEHVISGVPFQESPNKSGLITPEYLVIHYTATTSAASAIRGLTSPATKASAHVVLDVDGTLTQLVRFNQKAWHAGKSQWAGRSGCNGFTIGIEVVNPGPLRKQGSEFRDVYGRPWSGATIEAVHKNGGLQFHYWAAYSEAQMRILGELGPLLVEAYGLKDVIGHDDIAPGRKIDPGPAFPMDSYRGTLFGRSDDGPEQFSPTTVLNVRKGPSVEFDPVPGSPLKPGAVVQLLEKSDPWWHVATEAGEVEGWVHSRFLQQV